MTLVMRTLQSNNSFARSCMDMRKNLDDRMKPKRRQRVRSVDEFAQIKKLIPVALESEKSSLCSGKDWFSQSYSVGYMLQNLRTRRSTEFSSGTDDFEDMDLTTKNFDTMSCNDYASDSDCELDEEDVDEYDESCFDDSAEPSYFSNSTSSTRYTSTLDSTQGMMPFLRKSSYITRKTPRNQGASGLSKLLQQTNHLTESPEKEGVSLVEEVLAEVTKKEFGFRNCKHCLQIYACERSKKEQVSGGPLDSCKRDSYCSGECHLTHLSAMLQNQRKGRQ